MPQSPVQGTYHEWQPHTEILSEKADHLPPLLRDLKDGVEINAISLDTLRAIQKTTTEILDSSLAVSEGISSPFSILNGFDEIPDKLEGCIGTWNYPIFKLEESLSRTPDDEDLQTKLLILTGVKQKTEGVLASIRQLISVAKDNGGDPRKLRTARTTLRSVFLEFQRGVVALIPEEKVA